MSIEEQNDYLQARVEALVNELGRYKELLSVHGIRVVNMPVNNKPLSEISIPKPLERYPACNNTIAINDY